MRPSHQGAGGGVDDRLAAGQRGVAVAAAKDVIVGRELVDPAPGGLLAS
jgi:hypothetical protein